MAFIAPPPPPTTRARFTVTGLNLAELREQARAQLERLDSTGRWDFDLDTAISVETYDGVGVLWEALVEATWHGPKGSE